MQAAKFFTRLIYRHLWLSLIVVLEFLIAGPAICAEPIKIGVMKISAFGSVFIAQEKGYFAAEGFEPQLLFFEASPAVAVAVVSGDIDVGASGLTGALYGMASQGALHLIAGNHREVPNFHSQAIAVSTRAYMSGLEGYRDFAGHSFAATAIGAPPHYTLALLAEKYGFDLKSVQLIPLQTIPNAISAIIGGRADATVLPGSAVIQAVERGEMKLLGWVGDETPFQLGALYTATKTADTRRDFVERFLRAFRRGARDYHDAFSGAKEQREDGPTAPEIATIVGKYVNQSADQVRSGISYVDAQGRLDIRDVLHQIEWFRSQQLLKAAIPEDAFFDRRYVIALP